MFTPDPIQRHAGPPASSAPLHDYFSSPRPGADANYVVLPRSLIEAMPLPWQQHMNYLLSEFHQAFAHVQWPVYRVQPSRHEKLVDLDEDQLAEVGYLVEIDAGGDVVYRNRAGQAVERPAETTVLVSCLDPIPPPRQQPAAGPGGRPTGPRPGPIPQAPANQPPRTVEQEREDTPPSGFPAQQPPPGQPGQPFGPTGYQRPGRRSRPGQDW
ncbi:MAG TPA: hypothetical protein VHF06_23995 [Pseudonocardiaceae bacterium]|nr:hypothetical protein [Pseudonocardiaceae bacterium]